MTRSPRLAALVSLGLALAPARGEARDTGPFLLGHESVATVEGANALFWNPAAAGTRYPRELLLAFTDAEDGGRLYRGALSGPGGGLAVAGERHGPTVWTLGAAGGERGARLGVAMARLSGGSPRGHATDWTVGGLLRPSGWLSLGAVGRHLGEPTFDGVRLDRSWQAGVGLRPLALLPARAHTWGPRLSLSADVRGERGDRAEDLRARFGAEAELSPGLVVRGAYENGGGFQLGFALLGPRGGYHAHSDYDPDRIRRSTTHALSLHTGEDESVLGGRGARRAGELRMRGMLGDDALSGVSFFGGPPTTPVAPIHQALERALEDRNVRGVLLDLRGIANMAQIEELRQRVLRLRRAGKPVVAYLEYGGGRGDLYLASACDRIVATDEADFSALGLRVERRYYRRLLADWSLRIDRSSVGPYKSAYRNFSVDSTPPADREVIERSLDVHQELFVSAVSADRRMDRARLVGLLDGRMWPPVDLQRAGLIDSIGYREDARRILGRLAGLGARPRMASLARLRPAERPWRTPRPIAVVYASGGIETGRSGSDVLNGPYFGPETLVPQLERAFRDRETRAVVLRVESGGGSSLATSLIHHALERIKRDTRKPLVVSMGSVAGSGGYQIALPGDRLFADRFTRTGSIGVVFVKPSLEGWYEQHRVRQDAFERGTYMDGWSWGKDWDERAQAAADSAVRWTYESFKAKVGAARRLTPEQVERVAQGRVWMGEDARDRGLVDQIGGLEEAIADARRRARIPEGQKIELAVYRRPPPSLVARLLGTALQETWEHSLAPRDPAGIQLRADVDGE